MFQKFIQSLSSRLGLKGSDSQDGSIFKSNRPVR